RAEIHVEFQDTFVPEVTRNRTVPESTRSDRQKFAYSCEGRVHFRSSSVDRSKTWSGKCRAVYIVWCQSCVEKKYVGRRGRQASRPKRFRQSVHRRSHLRGARREAVKTDPSSAIEREFL